MTWSDLVVDEVRRVRDEYAARFSYDLRAICHNLKEQDIRSGRKAVSYAADSSPIEPDHLVRPNGPTEPGSETTTNG
jgi:hypothetical protein